MKRRLFAAAVGAAMAVTMAGVVSADHGGDVEKPLCADITGGGGQLLEAAPDTGPYDLTFGLSTFDRCGGVLFTLYVFDTEAACETPGSTPIATLEARGTDATNQVAFFATDVSPDDSVWVYATSSRGKTVFDTAPDTVDGCVEVTDDPPLPGKMN
jgi:hypothetical protein